MFLYLLISFVDFRRYPNIYRRTNIKIHNIIFFFNIFFALCVVNLKVVMTTSKTCLGMRVVENINFSWIFDRCSPKDVVCTSKTKCLVELSHKLSQNTTFYYSSKTLIQFAQIYSLVLTFITNLIFSFTGFNFYYRYKLDI